MTDTLNLPEQSRSAKSVMMSAHALCPTDLPHPERMRWMADYFMKHFGFAYATAALLAERERCAKLCEELANHKLGHACEERADGEHAVGQMLDWKSQGMRSCASAIRGTPPASQGEGE